MIGLLAGLISWVPVLAALAVPLTPVGLLVALLRKGAGSATRWPAVRSICWALAVALCNLAVMRHALPTTI